MDTQNSKLTIGYWPLRGLVQHVFTLLEYTGTEYNFVKITDRPNWEAGKDALIEGGMDFPNLPYLIDGDVQISESTALLLHCAGKYGDASLLYTPENRAKFFEIKGVVWDILMGYVMPAYMSPDLTALKATAELKTKQFHKKLGSLDRILGKQDYLMGGHITAVDFLFAEVVERLNAMEKDLEINILGEFTNIAAFLQRFISIPKIKAFRQSDRFMTGPYNNTMAIWK